MAGAEEATPEDAGVRLEAGLSQLGTPDIFCRGEVAHPASTRAAVQRTILAGADTLSLCGRPPLRQAVSADLNVDDFPRRTLSPGRQANDQAEQESAHVRPPGDAAETRTAHAQSERPVEKL